MIDNHQFNLITPENFRKFHNNLFSNKYYIDDDIDEFDINEPKYNILQYGYQCEAKSIFEFKDENKNFIIPLNKEIKPLI